MEQRQNKTVQLGSLVKTMTPTMESVTEQDFQTPKNQKYSHTTSVPQQSLNKAEIFRKVANEVCPNFKASELLKPILNNMYFYALNQKCDWDLKKGLLFYGVPGTGKSTLIKILAEFQRKYGRGFKVVNCSTIAAEFSTFGTEALNESTSNEGYRGCHPVERAFDELGREIIPAKHFGNELNVMQYIIQTRYEFRNSVKTHATTNISFEDIETKYGKYIYDRCFEMFNFIEINGQSLRF